MKRLSGLPVFATWISVFSLFLLSFYLFLKFQFGFFVNFRVKLAFSVVFSAIFSPPWIGIIAQIAPSAVGLNSPPVGPDRWKKYQKAFIGGVAFFTVLHLLFTVLGDFYIFNKPTALNSIYHNALYSLAVALLGSASIIGIGLVLEVSSGDKEAKLEGSD
ncbi:hypothetical protein [Salinibacter sp. 10B]|uniref:hypothetical protein n=1 Tax=Salinibacter sp. 10B TaxID=1923971 RepID=UPI0011B0D698|nr:hypothetical protein [Salinibacter sp. 10B]